MAFTGTTRRGCPLLVMSNTIFGLGGVKPSLPRQTPFSAWLGGVKPTSNTFSAWLGGIKPSLPGRTPFSTWPGGFYTSSSRRTSFSAWLGGVKPSSSHRTPFRRGWEVQNPPYHIEHHSRHCRFSTYSTNTYHPRKRAGTLVFEDGGFFSATNTLSPSEMSQCARFRGWYTGLFLRMVGSFPPPLSITLKRSRFRGCWIPFATIPPPSTTLKASWRARLNLKEASS